MAAINVQELAYGVAEILDGVTPVNGTTITVSGILRDSNTIVVYDPAQNGTLWMYSGEYINAPTASGDGYFIDVLDASVYGLVGIDGSQYRNKDGTYKFHSDASGTFYIFTKEAA